MFTVKDIYDFLCTEAPLELQLGFDNSGFLVGRAGTAVNKVLLALDITENVVDEAIHEGVQLIISHHPVIFHPLKKLTDEKLLRLVENGISAVCMHTNLDIADDGVNDVLLALLGAAGSEVLDEEGCGRLGELTEKMTLPEFLEHCTKQLKAKGLRYYDAGRPVKRIAVMGGAGGDSVHTAFLRGCDTYITADIKYNRFLEAAELGINLIDADHFCTENPIMAHLENKLSSTFSDVDFLISKRHSQVVSFYVPIE